MAGKEKKKKKKHLEEDECTLHPYRILGSIAISVSGKEEIPPNKYPLDPTPSPKYPTNGH